MNINIGDMVQTENGNIYRVIKIEKFQRGWQKGNDYISGELLAPNPDRLHPPKGKSYVNMHANMVKLVDIEYCHKQIQHWKKVLNLYGTYGVALDPNNTEGENHDIMGR